VRIVVLCEGKTEAALTAQLREFVQRRATPGSRVGVDAKSLDGQIMRKKLETLVRLHASDHEVCGVIVLTDVYPDFKDAADAKERVRDCAGGAAAGSKLRVHAAQFEVEAWLLPFWDEIARSLKVSAKRPGGKPEDVNHLKPPSLHLEELYRRAKPRPRRYDKVTEAPRWLTWERLPQAASECPELKLFLNSLLDLAGAESLP
jgi:hypothetical protein